MRKEEGGGAARTVRALCEQYSAQVVSKFLVCTPVAKSALRGRGRGKIRSSVLGAELGSRSYHIVVLSLYTAVLL